MGGGHAPIQVEGCSCHDDFRESVTHCDLNFFDAGVDVKDRVVPGTNDGLVLDDDNLKRQEFNPDVCSIKKQFKVFNVVCG